ncbi:MAG: hypothetical protein K0S10_1864 [Rubrobacteraceae bacterium]|nr:hypothetical protein [Rubrobacteraceae bacterium]
MPTNNHELAIWEFGLGERFLEPERTTVKSSSRLCTSEVRGSNPFGSTPIISAAVDAISPLASTEPPLVPRRASPPQLRFQTLDSQALLLELLQKSVPLSSKDNDAPDVFGMLRYLP